MKTIEKNKRNRLLSMITHDLKSPLNGIIGFTGLLRTKLESNYPDPIALKSLEQITLAGQAILSLVDDILTMAKIEAGNEPPVFDRVTDLNKEIESSLEVFYIEAKAKGIRINFNFAEKIPEVNWDIHKIKVHVLNNVLSNALRFTPVGGTIDVKLNYVGGWVTIQVQDNGPGLKTKDLNSIFDHYTTGETPTNIRSGGGHGYGLYNAKLFVESHNGRIFAENIKTLYQTGARFTILLPIDAEVESFH